MEQYKFKRTGAQMDALFDEVEKNKEVVKFITTPMLLDNRYDEFILLNSTDNDTIKGLFENSSDTNIKTLIFIYNGFSDGIEQLTAPLNIQTFYYDDAIYAVLRVSFQHPITGKNNKFTIQWDEDSAGFTANKVEEVDGGGSNIKKVTQAEYDAIANKEDILYVIIG